ncbi:MAG: hypothetical protein AAFW60_02950, partial [Pseudomonadota bacterium]
MSGTLFCLSACGAPTGLQVGAPADHAAPDIAPDIMGWDPVRYLQTPDRKMRLVPPDGWQLYADPWQADYGYFDVYSPPTDQNYLAGVLFHPDLRVRCQTILERDLKTAHPQRRWVRDETRFARWMYGRAHDQDIPFGFVGEFWRHPKDDQTDAPIDEAQWLYTRWVEDYPAIGFGASDQGE